MEAEGVRNGADVTIYLMAPKSTAEQGNVTKKRRQSLEPEVQNPPSLALGTIHADSSRLRECSKYFDTCMSGRWTTHSTRGEFYLEVHTDVRFYHQCFDLMYFPSEPMESVGNCIELLKVASQIQCDEVMDNGVRYLAAVPWSDEEEKQIRSFYSSGQLSSSNFTSDLCKRLQVLLTGEERHQNLLNLLQRVLSRSLQITCSEAPFSLNPKSRRESGTLFRELFKAIVCSGRGPGKCRKVLESALKLVTEESEKILGSLKRACREGARPSVLFRQIGNFCYLFEALRWASSTQALVELVLRDGDVAPLLQSEFPHFSRPLASNCKRWAKMMSTIFQDVLDGRLFLNTAERLALFSRWSWLLKTDYFEPDAPLSPTLVSSFIMGFPHEEQEKIFTDWLSSLDDPAHKADCDLSEAHSQWAKQLVLQAEKLADALECSSTG